MKKKPASPKVKTAKKPKKRRKPMAQPSGHGKTGGQWQRQADHFQKIIVDMQAVVADPASTPEEVAEANQTIVDMTANLARLSAKHGVTPAV